jgi:hypothetical protein
MRKKKLFRLKIENKMEIYWRDPSLGREKNVTRVDERRNNSKIAETVCET